MNKAYVIDVDGTYYSVIANHRPKDAVVEMPKENGEYVTDIDWVDVLDVFVDGETVKQAVVNPTKKADKLAALQAEEDAKAAAQADRQAKADALRAKGPGDLATLPQMRDAIIQILDYLELR